MASYEYLDKTGAQHLAQKAKSYSDNIKVKFGNRTAVAQSGQVISIPFPTLSEVAGQADLSGYLKTITFTSSASWSTKYTVSGNNINLPTTGWGISITGSAGKVSNKLTVGSKTYDGSTAVTIVKGDIGLGNVENLGSTSEVDWGAGTPKKYFTNEGANKLNQSLTKQIDDNKKEVDRKIGEIQASTCIAYAISATAQPNATVNGQIITFVNDKFYDKNSTYDIKITGTDATDIGHKAIKTTDGTIVRLTSLKIGDTIFIKEENVPDRWLSEKSKDGLTRTFSQLETDNRNLYAKCVTGDQNKVEKAGTADNANKLENHPASYFATASGLTSANSNLQTLSGKVTTNTNNISKNATAISTLSKNVTDNYVPYTGAKQGIYTNGHEIGTGASSAVSSLNGSLLKAEGLKVTAQESATGQGTATRGVVSSTLSNKALTFQTSFSNVQQTTVYRNNAIEANDGTYYLPSSATGQIPTATLLCNADFTAIDTNTIDGWFK